MLKELRNTLVSTLAERIRSLYGVEHEPFVQIPPKRNLGDFASPSPLHLAKTLRRKPRLIAVEIADGLPLPATVREVRVEGAGYLNFFLDRAAVTASLLRAPPLSSEMPERQKIIVEHTNINPNKAAHIGHLRNAVLGDVLVRSLRCLGHPVEVQNYIDDTGVQVADVVVGFLDLRGLTLDQVRDLPEPFDYACWDLYASVGGWFEEDPKRQELRRETLHQLESGEGERAQMGRLVARRIVQRHLTTMARLGITYDVLTHESDILGLDFFKVAFAALQESDAIRLEAGGKNKGCWVMPLSQSEEFAGLADPDKVIIRSDGTVTYVGKDIAYQLWKFGLLGRDFNYRPWDSTDLWQTCTLDGTAGHPAFGAASKVINVIDARQSYLQKVVRAGLQAMGHDGEAERSIHFAYEMVSLSTGTARQLGYLQKGESGTGRSLEMSGRKGIGVKADDLLDQMQSKARNSVEGRYPELDPEELDELGRQIATAALRFFMVKATTTRVIAFDLEDALSFEGETGPYLQYSIVRERNIRRKLAAAGRPTEVSAEATEQLGSDLWEDDLWDLVLAASTIAETVEKAAESLELSLIARQALDLAGKFHGTYHRHNILNEDNEDLRLARMASNQVFRHSLLILFDLLGLSVPEKM